MNYIVFSHRFTIVIWPNLYLLELSRLYCWGEWILGRPRSRQDTSHFRFIGILNATFCPVQTGKGPRELLFHCLAVFVQTL